MASFSCAMEFSIPTTSLLFSATTGGSSSLKSKIVLPDDFTGSGAFCCSSLD